MNQEASTATKPKRFGFGQIANWFVVGSGAMGIFKGVIEYVTTTIEHEELILTIFIQVGGVAFMTLIIFGPLVFILFMTEASIGRLLGRTYAERYSYAVPLIALIAGFVLTIAYFALNHGELMASLDVEARRFYEIFGGLVVLVMCVYAYLFLRKYAFTE
jgi:hypothetical protein